jgi:hypothetical protein
MLSRHMNPYSDLCIHLRQAREKLEKQLALQTPIPTPKVPRIVVRGALWIMALGFMLLGIASFSQPLGAVSGLLVGSTFLTIGFII